MESGQVQFGQPSLSEYTRVHANPSTSASYCQQRPHSIIHEYMNPPPPAQHFHTQPHHGTKRSAPDDEVEQSSNISTHFKKLRLNQKSLPHPTTLSPVGVSMRSNSHAPTDSPIPSHNSAPPQTHMNHVGTSQEDGINPSPPQIPTSDFMPLDDTPNRIYIHDLSSEIAQIEAEESSSSDRYKFFLPDIDKKVSAIPTHLLHDPARNGAESSASNQQLILYRDPTSISVPPEEDVVRRAIIETRKAHREKIRRDAEASAQRMEDQAVESLPDPNGSRHDKARRNGDDSVEMHDDLYFDDDGDAMDLE